DTTHAKTPWEAGEARNGLSNAVAPRARGEGAWKRVAEPIAAWSRTAVGHQLKDRAPRSMRLDARLADDLCAADAFGSELSGRLLGRVSDGFETEDRQALLNVGQRNNIHDLAMQQRRNFLRGCGRNDEGKPSLSGYICIARFRHGGHVRQRRRPRLARHRQRAQLAIVDLRDGRRQRAEGNGRMSPDR